MLLWDHFCFVLKAALDISNFVACWLRQASQPDWLSTSEPSIIQTLSDWYWYNNPLFLFDSVSMHALTWIHTPTANTTTLCWLVVVKSELAPRFSFFRANWPLKPELGISTSVQPGRDESCSTIEIHVQPSEMIAHLVSADFSLVSHSSLFFRGHSL
jgi:hypothetical protein